MAAETVKLHVKPEDQLGWLKVLTRSLNQAPASLASEDERQSVGGEGPQ